MGVLVDSQLSLSEPIAVLIQELAAVGRVRRIHLEEAHLVFDERGFREWVVWIR